MTCVCCAVQSGGQQVQPGLAEAGAADSPSADSAPADSEPKSALAALAATIPADQVDLSGLSFPFAADDAEASADVEGLPLLFFAGKDGQAAALDSACMLLSVHSMQAVRCTDVTAVCRPQVRRLTQPDCAL